MSQLVRAPAGARATARPSRGRAKSARVCVWACVLALVGAQPSPLMDQYPWVISNVGNSLAFAFSDGATLVRSPASRLIYRFGGGSSDTPWRVTDDAFVYDDAGAVATWTRLTRTPAWPPPRARHCAVWYGGDMWVFFGRGARVGIGGDVPVDLDDVWRFVNGTTPVLVNATAASATGPGVVGPSAGLPRGRSLPACVVRGTAMLMQGGVVYNDALVLSDAWLFDFATLSWSLLSPAAAAAPPSAFGAASSLTFQFRVTASTADPPAVYGHAFAYSATADALVVHGGRWTFPPGPGSFGTTTGNLWVLQFGAAADGSVVSRWYTVTASQSSGVPRAFGVGLLSADGRFCVFGGVQPVQAVGDDPTNDVACLPLRPFAKTPAAPPPSTPTSQTNGGIVLIPLPTPSPSTSPISVTPTWVLLLPPATFQEPDPRFRCALVGNVVAGANAANFISPSNPDVFIMHGGRDLQARPTYFLDVWYLALPAASSQMWTTFLTTTRTTDILMLSYLAYSTALTLMTTICFLCLVRRDTWCMCSCLRWCGFNVQPRQPIPSSGRTLASIQPMGHGVHGGVDPAIIDALPTVVYKRRCECPTITSGSFDVAPSSAPTAAPADASAATPSKPSEHEDVRVVTASGSEVFLAEQNSPTDGNDTANPHAQSPRVDSVLAAPLAPVSAPLVPASSVVVTAPPHTVVHVDEYEIDTCSICLSQFEDDEVLKVLPCLHRYHGDCISRWLAGKRLCPLCKADVMAAAT